MQSRKSTKEVLELLNKISKPDTQWRKEAEWRQSNRWWVKHWQKVHLRYLRLKRKLTTWKDFYITYYGI